jgi:sterol-4alpha-carboxylate 3-dehydrogenase (decarboxylating)
MVAYLMVAFSRLLRALGVSWQPLLTPFKVALAGTHHYYSCEKAKRDLGYVPRYSLEKSIENTIKSFEYLRNSAGGSSKQAKKDL